MSVGYRWDDYTGRATKVPTVAVTGHRAEFPETPDPYSKTLLFEVSNTTARSALLDEAVVTVAAAFGFMESVSGLLPYSEEADRAGDAIARRLRENHRITKL